MGTEASKPIDGPEEFGQSGNEFQVISPMSDLSNPSDIHRLTRNRNLHKTALGMGLSNPTRKAPTGGAPMAPSHFYFPTKETERAVERAERRSQQQEKKLKKLGKENEGPTLLKKTKKILKKTQKVMTGCFTDNQAALEERQVAAEEPKHYNGTLGIARKVVPKKSKSFDEFCDEIKQTKSFETRGAAQRPNYTATGHSFVIREAEGLISKPEQYAKPLTQPGNSATLHFAGAILHEADDYFTRLSTGAVDESPYVDNKTLTKVAPALGYQSPDSPVSNLFEDNMSGSVPSKQSEDTSLAESDAKRSRHSASPSTHEKEDEALSPTEDLVGYQKAIGTIAATPGYYPQDDSEETEEKPKGRRVDHKGHPMVLKPSSDVVPYASREMVEQVTRDLVPVSENDDSSHYGHEECNTKSAFRLKEADAFDSDDESEDRLSKLESLFRPVLPPALSSDDAETKGSYDPWEIKVTESAPSVLEGKDYKSLALRRSESPERASNRGDQKLGGSFSPSMLSIDSQVDATPAKTKTTVSDQASHNADFLFSERGRAFLNKKEATGSISTLGSRSRISSRGISSKGDQFTLRDAINGSVGLAPKRSIDVPAIENKLSDLTEVSASSEMRSSILKTGGMKVERKRVSFGGLSEESGSNDIKHGTLKATPYRGNSLKKTSTNSPFLRFKSARTMFEKQTTVEVPSIQNKVSDLSEEREVPSPRETDSTIVSEEEHLDRESLESASMRSEVHWAYNQDASVTPAFGKAVKNATKSPFLRFENAKSKFGSGASKSSPAKKTKDPSPQKKAPYKSPRSSRAKLAIKSRESQTGGSVASKIQELNERVVAAKIDRKKHRWTKSNPRKYGVIPSNAVRTRALVSYKAKAVGFDQINYMAAAKFNSIPLDDDSVDSTPERGSEAHFESNLPPLLGNVYSDNTEELIDDEEEGHDDDEFSKLTADVASVATVRQELVSVPGYSGARMSAGSLSSASSGFSKVRKQVFRESHLSRPSTGSTTMSAILDKENSANLLFRTASNSVKPSEQTMVSKPDLHLSPTQRTTMQAQKWRTLAAAAHERDSQKKLNKGFRGLAVRNGNKNHLPAY